MGNITRGGMKASSGCLINIQNYLGNTPGMKPTSGRLKHTAKLKLGKEARQSQPVEVSNIQQSSMGKKLRENLSSECLNTHSNSSIEKKKENAQGFKGSSKGLFKQLA